MALAPPSCTCQAHELIGDVAQVHYVATTKDFAARKVHQRHAEVARRDAEVLPHDAEVVRAVVEVKPTAASLQVHDAQVHRRAVDVAEPSDDLLVQPPERDVSDRLRCGASSRMCSRNSRTCIKEFPEVNRRDRCGEPQGSTWCTAWIDVVHRRYGKGHREWLAGCTSRWGVYAARHR